MTRSIAAALGPAFLLCFTGGILSAPPVSAEEYYTKKFDTFPKCCSVLRNHTKKMNESGNLSTKVIDNSALFVGMTFNGLPQFYSCTPTADGGGVLGSNRADKQLGLTLAE